MSSKDFCRQVTHLQTGAHCQSDLSQQNPSRPSSQHLEYLNSYLSNQNYLSNSYSTREIQSADESNYYGSYIPSQQYTYINKVHPHMSQSNLNIQQLEKENRASFYHHRIVYPCYQNIIQQNSENRGEYQYQNNENFSMNLPSSPLDQGSLNTTSDNLQVSTSTESGSFSSSMGLNNSFTILNGPNTISQFVSDQSMGKYVVEYPCSNNFGSNYCY